MVDRKMFHIIVILLIYGVDTESVKCPKSCTCIESLVSDDEESLNLVSFNGNSSNESRTNGHLDTYKEILKSVGIRDREPVPTAIIDDNRTLPWNFTKEKKCSKSTRENVRDVFISNFSINSVNNSRINNSKEIRMKRTLKLNVSQSESYDDADAEKDRGDDKDEEEEEGEGEGEREGEEDDKKEGEEEEEKEKEEGKEGGETHRSPSGERSDGKRKEISTYKVVCTGMSDLKSLGPPYLPNPATHLIIRRTHFQSFNVLQQVLRESLVKLKQLTLLSISDGIINEKTSERYSLSRNLSGREGNSPRKTDESREFLPFASLQNPRLRSKVEPEFAVTEKSQRLQVLSLVNDTIRFLPPYVFHPFQNLKILNLSYNLIKFLDDRTFNPLGNLLRLDIRSNCLETLSEIMFKNLTKLLLLDVSGNFISSVAPSTFQYLTSLNVLNLARNPLSEKQEAVILLGTGKRLRAVDISKTGIKQIPGTLERSVRILNLMGNHLTSIRCGDLDSYSLLSYLNLKDNKISYVEDDALGRLEFLVDLQISENNLFQIPKSLPNNLEILNLSYNNIQNVSGLDLINLSALSELYLSYNQISNIEENAFNNLVHLKVLDLSRNPIFVLPNIYGLGKLTHLNLSHFTNIPGGYATKYKQFPVQTPEKIKSLSLESSPILTKIFLEDTKTLGSCKSLQELDVRFSNLTTMRKDIFSLLPSLRIVKVEGNPWHCGKEILILSDWLRNHESDEAVEDENEINTAHCSTPINLYKTPLVGLAERDFEDVRDDGDKSANWNRPPNERERTKHFTQRDSETPKPIQSLRGILGTGTSLTAGQNFSVQVSPARKMNLKKYNESGEKVKTLPNRGTKENVGAESNFRKTGKKMEETIREKNSTSATRSPFTRSYSTSESRNLTENCTSGGERNSIILPDDFSDDWEKSVNNSSDLKSTQVSFRTVKKPEAVTAKDKSSEKEYNSHLSFFILSSIGLVAMATITFTSVYFSRSRTNQNYQRQNQDIEVCSISTVGNELW